MARKRPVAQPAPQPAVTFVSPHGSLIVYHDGRKVAAFDGGRFVTADADVIAALRALPDYCTEEEHP